MNLALKISTLCIVLLSLTPESYALKQYRCAGVVQYRPCNDDRSIPALLEQKNRRSYPLKSARIEASSGESLRGRMTADIEPLVFSAKYEFNAERKLGIWTGSVYGDGPVVLNLRLDFVGSAPQILYMGKVVLRGKHTPFEFRSAPPPPETKWSWQISAKREGSGL